MSTQLAARERCPFFGEIAVTAFEPWKEVRTSAPSRASAVTQTPRAAMMQVYERSGGLARSNEVVCMLRRHTSQPVSLLARWIVAQNVVSFEWRADRLLPMFQFDPADMSIRADVAAVLAELDGTFDDWELATWFAEPNVWLQGGVPVDALEVDPRAVRAAARADRFIARG